LLTASCAEVGQRALISSPGTPALWRPALTEVPRVLPERDVEIYRQIHAHQTREQWAEADRLMEQLTDRTLVGHVLASRYLSSYPSKYGELREWLNRYADHPDASRIQKLAAAKTPAPPKKRTKRTRSVAEDDNDTDEVTPPKSKPGKKRGKRSADDADDPTPAKAKPAKKRKRVAEVDVEEEEEDEQPSATTSRRPRPPADSARKTATAARAASALAQYQLALKRGNYEAAEAVLASSAADAQLGATRVDGLRAELAHSLLNAGHFERAFTLAGAAARSREAVPMAPWIAGLAGFKIGKYREAADHFEASGGALRDEWHAARIAYWASRAHEAAAQPAAARRALTRAAGYSRTLYGMMARYRLGMAQEFDFSQAARADGASINRIGSTPEGRRAFGLIQIGLAHNAGEELMRRYRADGSGQEETYLAIADRGSLPDLAYHVSAELYTRTGKTYDPGLYPVPAWRPNSGFHLDRALIYAVMRQESAFQAKVVSTANARGLMQLIPPTAVWVAGDGSLKGERLGRLFDPEYNMELGQRFLRSLLDRGTINGNVAFAAAAYNAGEGALAKWTLREDPLLFMATIPYNETRQYVERVLYNMAAYRLRFGQRPAEIESLALNYWPIYTPQDGAL
jgi:soluble lytic murein transglycosylase-like protein